MKRNFLDIETHSLTEVDPEVLLATCSICGPSVVVQKSGNGYACQTARREAKRRFRESHPHRDAQDHMRPRSAHRVRGRDGDMGTCAICGPVAVIAHGRGYMCKNRADELGWKAAGKVQTRHHCGSWTRKDGSCPGCEDRWGIDLGYGLKALDYWGALGAEWTKNEGLSRRKELALDEGRESVKPGWKTLGSSEPWNTQSSVRPEYAALYGRG